MKKDSRWIHIWGLTILSIESWYWFLQLLLIILIEGHADDTQFDETCTSLKVIYWFIKKSVKEDGNTRLTSMTCVSIVSIHFDCHSRDSHAVCQSNLRHTFSFVLTSLEIQTKPSLVVIIESKETKWRRRLQDQKRKGRLWQRWLKDYDSQTLSQRRERLREETFLGWGDKSCRLILHNQQKLAQLATFPSWYLTSYITSWKNKAWKRRKWCWSTKWKYTVLSLLRWR